MTPEPVVKICGITRARDADDAARAGADWLGINFWPGSKRFVPADAAPRLAGAARSAADGIAIVGVFVDQPVAEIEAISAAVGLDYVQLHGGESPALCARFGARAIKAFAVRDETDVLRLDDYPQAIVLLDTPSTGFGGSGRTFDWTLAQTAVGGGRRILLAGGLDPENVAHAVGLVRPFGVDVASGVESAPGVKDPDKMRRFVAAAKGRR